MRKRRKQAEIATPHLEPKRVTPVDIQQKEFRLAMRGYNERDVDQFLDEVTEEVARLYADNKRLREEVEFGKTTRLETTGAAEAEGMLRRAREEAARIIAEATARASTVGVASAPSGGAAPGPTAPSNEIMGIFLARERAFLQNMANLIQSHAEGVKQDVRRVREQAPAEAPVADTTPAPTEEEAAETAEPGTAWESTREEPRPEMEPSARDIVDLTHEGDLTRAEAGGGSAEASEQAPDGSQGALSSVYGRTSASTERNDASGRLPHEGGSGGTPAPRIEDDDREDRSIRELFWGED
jgi:cell division initiation protein